MVQINTLPWDIDFSLQYVSDESLEMVMNRLQLKRYPTLYIKPLRVIFSEGT